MKNLVPAVTGEEVTEKFSDAIFTVVDGAWNIVAPFAGGALVLFLLVLLVRNVAGRRR